MNSSTFTVDHKILLGELLDGTSGGVHDIVCGKFTTVNSWLVKVVVDNFNKSATDFHVCVHGNFRAVRSIDTTEGQFSFDLIVKGEGEDGLLTSFYDIFHCRTTLSMEMEPEPFRRYLSNLQPHT